MSTQFYGIDWAGVERALGTARENTPHVGVLIAAWLKHKGWSQKKLARLSGISRTEINHLVKARRGAGPRSALKLEKATGVRAEFWMHAELMHKLNELRNEPAEAGD